MQSSTDVTRSSDESRPSADVELEDGEIEDDEDDEIWRQLEECEANSVPPNDSFGVNSLTCHSVASPRANTSSTTSTSQVVRTAGGYWAKMKPSTQRYNHQQYCVNQSARNVTYSESRRKNSLLVTFGHQSASNSTPGNHSPSQNLSQPAVSEHATLDGISSQTSNQNERRMVDTNDQMDGDEDELLELQLRLEALVSTMKRTSSTSGEAQGTCRQRNYVNLDDRKSHDQKCHPRLIASVRPIGSERRTDDNRRRSRRTSGRESDSNSNASDVEGQRRRHHDAQLLSMETGPNSAATSVQHERERILRIADPRQQLQAFLELLTRPRLAGTMQKGASARTESLIDTDMSTDSEVETTAVPYAPPNDVGHYRASSAPSSPETADNGSAPSFLRELDNTSLVDNEPKAYQPNSEKVDDAEKQNEASEEDDEEEVAALRELALASMVKAKAKETPATSSPQSGKVASADVVENWTSPLVPVGDNALETIDEGETELVITLNKDILNKSVELARRLRRQQVGHQPAKLPLPNAGKVQSPRKEESQWVKATSGIHGKGNGATTVGVRTAPVNRTTAQHAPTVSKVNLARVLNFVHKPVLIPLDDTSSSEEDEKSERTNSAGNRMERKVCPANSSSGGCVGASANEETGAPLVRQMENRLRTCLDDLTKHQSCLHEDQKRLRTLESIVRRYKTDLRLAEMKMQKLKRELFRIESQSATYRVSIAKFNTEMQKVQGRVDKNLDLQRVYLRQWKEIEHLVSKHKIDVSTKIPKPSILQVITTKSGRVPAQRLSVKRKSASESGKKTGGKKPKKASAGVSHHHKRGAIAAGLETVQSDPLRWFRSYRLSPYYRTLRHYKLDSITFGNKLDPFVPLCPFSLSGQCLDPACVWQHERDYTLTPVELIVDLLSYRPDVVAKEADQKTTMAFAEELWNSLHSTMPINDILLYCLSKLKTDSCALGVDLAGRKWIIKQDPKRYNEEAMATKEPSIVDDTPDNETSPARYYSAVTGCNGDHDQD